MSVLNELRQQCVDYLFDHPKTDLKVIVRSVLNMPTDDDVLDPSRVKRSSFERALAAFAELMTLAIMHNDDPATVAAAIILGAHGQPDLSEAEKMAAHTEKMVEALEHWLTFAPQGLMDATVAMKEMNDALL